MYTKGPWRVFENGADYPGIVGENSKDIVVFGLEGEECGIRGNTKEERLSNARLIAAAPQLVEALRECSAHLNHCTEGDSIALFAMVQAAFAAAGVEQEEQK